MARDLDGSADAYTKTSAVVTAVPLTLAAWFNCDSAAAAQVVCAFSAGTSSFEGFLLLVRGDLGGDPIEANALAGGAEFKASSTTGYSTGTWHHGCAVFTSASSRTIYLDGGSSATDTSTGTPSGIANSQIGRSGITLNQQHFNGRIAECAVWDAALTASEASALSSGVSPLHIRSANLVSYTPLLGLATSETDYVDTTNWTAVSAPPQGDHAPVAPMFGFDFDWQGAFTEAAVGGLSIPVAMHGYRQRHQSVV